MSHGGGSQVGPEDAADGTGVTVSLDDLAPLNTDLVLLVQLVHVNHALAEVELGVLAAFQALDADDGMVAMLLRAAAAVANEDTTGVQAGERSGRANLLGLLGGMGVLGRRRVSLHFRHCSDLKKKREQKKKKITKERQQKKNNSDNNDLEQTLEL